MNGKGTTSDVPVERISGSVERVTFHSEESGFCVLRIKVKGKRELVTVIGSAATITPGEFVECVGTWHNDNTHGLQFKTTHLKTVPPSTLEGIEKYLGSGMVKGIGPHFAKVLVKAFGVDVFTVIEETPEKILRATIDPLVGPQPYQGRELALGIKADADRQTVVISADAYNKSEQLRGDGDAKSAQTYAAAFQKDPEFYEFYRSINAYTMVFDNKGDMMILDPNSEFFKYLKRSDGGS